MARAKNTHLCPEALGSNIVPLTVPKSLGTSQAVNVKWGHVRVYSSKAPRASVRTTAGSPVWPLLMALSGGGHHGRLARFWDADLLPAHSSFELC